MSKILTTIALVSGGVLPLFADISVYHLLNPDWDSHARVHEAWRLSTNFCIFSLGMYLLWAKGKEMLAAILSLCIHFGFFIAIKCCLAASLLQLACWVWLPSRN